jgi:uncharacterized membrane protein
MNMQSWSDHGLGTVNSWSIIIAIIGAAVVFASVAFIYLTTAEQSRRASQNENLAKEDAAQKSKTLAEAEEKLAKAQNAADAATQRAKALEEKHLPRSITDEQHALFLAELKDIPKGKITVTIFSHDPEITQYANQLRDLINDAGFDADFVKTDIDADWTPAGVILGVKNDKIQPPFAVPLQHAFSGIGIHTEGIIDASIEDTDTLHIIVGSK